jgi:hypothetical protein
MRCAHAEAGIHRERSVPRGQVKCQKSERTKSRRYLTCPLFVPPSLRDRSIDRSIALRNEAWKFHHVPCEHHQTDGFLALARDRRSHLYSRQPRRILADTPLEPPAQGQMANPLVRMRGCYKPTPNICGPGGDRFWSIHLGSRFGFITIVRRLKHADSNA